MVKKFNLGDIVELKKKHPCGENKWEVMRVGIDFRIKCLGCEKQVWLSRPVFEKRVKKIIKSSDE